MRLIKLFGLGIGLAALALPAISFADTYPHIVVQTQTDSGYYNNMPSATVTVNANRASLSGTPSGSNSVSFSANFSNGTQTVTAQPGSFNVSVSTVSGYSYTYSNDCSGSLYNTETRYCTITAHPYNYNNYNNGNLTVYVQVNNQYSNNYYCPSGSYNCNANYLNSAPSDFTIQVTGNNPSPSSFQGSQYGTQVQLGSGYYTVDPSHNMSGWNYQLSGSCSGNINNNQSLSCTVTYTPNGNQNYYPNNNYCPNGSYNCYPYQNGNLTCAPAYQQATLGSSVSFTATGGNGVYSWGTPNSGLLNGPTFVWQATTPGPQTVVVTSGGQTAACSVNVVSSAYYANYPGTYPPYQPPSYYPRPHLPNTGFAPHSLWQYALAALLLAGFGLSIVYVRNARISRTQ